MKAVRISRASHDGTPYSASDPAPASAIKIVEDLPRPQPSKPGEVLVQVKASTVIRDNLAWPELYADPPAHLGNDFSGIVAAVHGAAANVQVGDEVFGMTDAHRGGAWAEYVVASSEEVSPRPARLSWAEAASLPLSAMTADQALFEQAGLPCRQQEGDASSGRRVLITGASGAVGTLLVQLALGAGHDVVAATSSNPRNAAYLHGLGAGDAIEYEDAFELGEFDAVIDTVGGAVLRRCWEVVRKGGRLVTIDSSSWNFVEEHHAAGVTKDGVDAKFFIVKPSQASLQRVSEAVESGRLEAVVARTFPMIEASAAYELGDSRAVGRGKVVLEM